MQWPWGKLLRVLVNLIHTDVILRLADFALNIGDSTQPFVEVALHYLFRYAETVNFKLYISMDVQYLSTANA
jgi:hypothetical protein